ncbi:hypothetical protein CHU_2530 [Cytophaga hutchinsonii ATCC 33406]|jgi:hypothetical protein|uniref:Fructose-6-phosphate aldolase n=2 Tax=Cytophaga hutchinsonii TaxID=985 RepID=A0A6N4STN2_CYTH3|nr:hypothetical protein CHU_2530 [Cytophaga hutchinsonii ATCC 33406]SFY03658.1 hypothetical protein SAMN04487930_1248 [Cytophaga hutchinsonii ATCC 33406]
MEEDIFVKTPVGSDMFIIKVKGKAKIPDYIQLRDEKMVLVAYFRADRPLKILKKLGLEGKEEAFLQLIDELPFGKLQKFALA